MDPEYIGMQKRCRRASCPGAGISSSGFKQRLPIILLFYCVWISTFDTYCRYCALYY
ncbi:unnamed protein product [Gongylonema pulchrum]|uniref:Uncharacterized protein n=1 Tax=Gongylonema pulchrum TaxID=637853 RepID=A0A183DTW2_9BILA|nr:unnamed protein product [Gongylonema pulchrum]